ncbi:hypothetical protein COV24_04670 [candidate division WWE3 bacterium CG10_big_fil_rev_8_21_14_0_10_32_10]|uniref:Thioredoxin domain-containing protein n=1 Tax=candidate division WWE3 bacterium CG10_big_fil_rev_8_21_14_0_10_32_10 TaxID=1975090 RepID=A0A2H0RBA6_UNCKA|nr:MAG: hypothetical protein COV24_04670 [candidate division WWE3 bacterium CG10_big_fil_rev_8_21_14_0_10_32_10]
MIFLSVFAFISGIVTILSPCILPVLPIILSGGLIGGKKRPLGIVAGFILSFTFFTLALSSIVKITGLSANLLRTLSIVIIFLFGLILLFPNFNKYMEQLFTKFSSLVPNKTNKTGFVGGFILGLSLGLIWTPCVGPIIATVITLAATSSLSTGTVLITFSYSLGTALPMLAIIYGGNKILNNNKWLLKNTSKIQQVFAIFIILTAVGIYFNFDRNFQTYILDKFPNYGTGLTSLEDNTFVKKQLATLKDQPTPTVPSKNTSDFPNAPELIYGGEWFNSKPLTMQGLKGKVVLVDFWTYTCINCIRTLPYIEKWHEKYANKGLVIIGVHTPEFEFEKDPKNLQKAINDFGLKYPIVQDNNYQTWKAYNNHYWPAKYFIDKNGKIRDTHFGEGDYDESEKLIQKLLQETGVDTSTDIISNIDYKVFSKTPETYLGYNRIANFGSIESIKKDTKFSYTSPAKLSNNTFSYSGKWLVKGDYAMPYKNSKLTFNFESKNVYLVMRPVSENTQGKVTVYLDGQLVDENAGKDVISGTITIDSDELYELINLKTPGQHILEIEFLDNNVELFAFTFG